MSSDVESPVVDDVPRRAEADVATSLRDHSGTTWHIRTPSPARLHRLPWPPSIGTRPRGRRSAPGVQARRATPSTRPLVAPTQHRRMAGRSGICNASGITSPRRRRLPRRSTTGQWPPSGTASRGTQADHGSADRSTAAPGRTTLGRSPDGRARTRPSAPDRPPSPTAMWSVRRHLAIATTSAVRRPHTCTPERQDGHVATRCSARSGGTMLWSCGYRTTGRRSYGPALEPPTTRTGVGAS